MQHASVKSAEQLTSSRKCECDCASRFNVRLARASDYPAFKKLLNAGSHPAFIGKNTMMRNSINGGALFYDLDGEAVAVSLINPHYGILLCLNVRKEHRGHGLGAAIVNFLMPNFVRALENKAPWFESLGYRRIGDLKRGIRLNTQVMARAALFDLAGKLTKAWALSPNIVLGRMAANNQNV
jgi:GNAT superfamily N-acetyltransferase